MGKLFLLLVLIGMPWMWWSITKAAWKDAGVTGDYMKALAVTVIVAPLITIGVFYFGALILDAVFPSFAKS